MAVPRVEVPAHHGRGKVNAQFSSNTLDTLDCREMFNLTGEFKTLGNIVLYMLCMLPWLHQLTFNVTCSRGEHGWLEQLHVAILISRNLSLWKQEAVS